MGGIVKRNYSTLIIILTRSPSPEQLNLAVFFLPLSIGVNLT